MKRIGAGIAVIVVAMTLVPPPAAAQNSSASLTPRAPYALESAGEVVITVSLWRAGRVAYQTFNGACYVTYSRAGDPPNTICSDEARAPEDYIATSGVLVFTAVEGSKTVKIPIVDDDRAEGDQRFTLLAWEEVNADPWIDRGDSVTVSIIDDERSGVATTATTTAGGQPSGSAPFSALAPTPPLIGDVPLPDIAVELASGELRPGPGFELTSEGSPQPAPAQDGGDGGSASSWLAPGLGTAAAGVGALAFMRRRKQWSPTRS
ncbi:MAG: hypothetical protein QOD92_3663 [Acidimicrobiaceae bacterium]|jgi:hypothetical protein